MGMFLVLTTAVLAVILAMVIKTDVHFTIRLPVKTTPENAFRFMSNPMVLKEIHPLVTGVEIKSQKPLEGVSGEYFKVVITEKLPLVGSHNIVCEVWTDKDTLTITNMAKPFWGLQESNVTYTFTQAGEPGSENGFIKEKTDMHLPWVLSHYVKAEAQRIHRQLLIKAIETLEKFSNQ